MTPQKKSGRFSYLSGPPEQQISKTPAEKENNTGQDPSGEQRLPERGTEERSGRDATPRSGGEVDKEQPSDDRKRRPTPRRGQTRDLQSVPKGEGRMKQDRSQLNIRIPTALKRRASAKAVLEGRDIGEVVEELLRVYLAS